MKKNSLLALSVAMAMPVSAQVFISEYVEGSSYNKAIELFNPDNNAVDLSGYQLKISFNGGSSNSTIALEGTINSKQTYVIAHSDIDSSAVVDFYTTKLKHNGDDTIWLEKDGQVIDSIGQLNVDPGKEWGSDLTSTADNSLVRQPQIATGDNNLDDNFDPAEQWLGFAKNTLANLGQHDFDGSSNPGDGDGGDDGGDNGEPPLSQCGDSYSTISAIQGESLSSPLSGETLWVEGVVTLDLQDSGYKGFYLQSADSDNDQNPASSEGIFVYHQSNTVNVGDHIRLQAKVSEYNEQTQLSNVNELTVCQSGVALPTAQLFSLPSDINARESVEGMLISLAQPVVIADTYNYGRYGQFSVSNQRLFVPTQVVAPGAAAAELAAQNLDKMILVEDGITTQNPETLLVPAPELTATNSLRSGDTIQSLTGVVSYAYGQYQIIPTQAVESLPSNPRTASPTIEDIGNARISSFNVLNYFNGDGLNGGYPTARGAKTAEEFERQRNKIISALAAINADVVGLMEIENDGYNNESAIADLVTGLNDVLGENSYQFVNAGNLGTDDIAVGLIYKPGKVELNGQALVLNSSNSVKDQQGAPLFNDGKNRPMLTQKFTHIESGEQFVVAVNHLKSKGSDCNSIGDPDLNDGQGNCNLTRTKAAQAVGDFLQQHYPDTATLVIGDFNAYRKEDPITTLATKGFANVFDSLNKQQVYSYVFKGEIGQLDHALANNTMTEHIVDASIWPINADEPRVLDYSTQFQNALQQAKFYAPDMYRSSDHDPVIIELNFTANGLFGDLDSDNDVDYDDISLFLTLVQSGELTDLAYDFNNDNQLNRRDVRGYTQLCTRARCATE